MELNSETTSSYTNPDIATVTILKLELQRTQDAGLIFISSDEIADLFIAVRDENEVRRAIDRGIKNAYHSAAERVQIYTNGKIDGPAINVIVELSGRQN